MRIDRIELLRRGNRKRIQARVVWENVDRPSYELYFEVDREHGDALSESPHPFLAGCIIPAMHYGERRVSIQGAVCSELLANLQEGVRILTKWFSTGTGAAPSIEPDAVIEHPAKSKGGHSGLFFSGGVDSFAVLRLNRLHYPHSHPRSFRDGILVFGLEQDDPFKFAHVRERLAPAANAAGVELLPVFTNVYLPYRAEDARRGFELWGNKLGGASLAAVGHALAGRLSSVSIAASQDLETLEPWGTHPLLDHCFGSSDLEVHHEGQSYSRVERTKLVAEWDIALRSLRVCNKYMQYSMESLNCGACEKCIRTMLTLLSLGALERTDAFPSKEVTSEMVLKHAQISREPGELVHGYSEILPGLERLGRFDLVRAVRRKIIEGRYAYIKDLMKRIAIACAARLGMRSTRDHDLGGRSPYRAEGREEPLTAVRSSGSSPDPVNVLGKGSAPTPYDHRSSESMP
jgi:hypothetical protein